MNGIRVALVLVVFGAAAVAGQVTASGMSSKRLVGTVGPGRTISLRTPSGRAVRSLRTGSYTLVIRDRSARDNFHLIGGDPTVPGRMTGVRFVGTRTWRVVLGKGMYRYVSDPHRATLHGSFRVG
jgi:hypothetical protein